MMSDIWPSELRVSKDRQRLVVTFNDGQSFDLSAELLRVLSPSAE
ncbi:gamma-butyrobetaine hydroxylase-like domain-containing protein, partial [Rhizobium ruizarguesonis]